MKSNVLVLLLIGVVATTNAALLGIDFGSKFTKVALVKPGVPFQIVTNTASKRKTSSMVGLTSEGERLYAGDADNFIKRKPDQVFAYVKNLLGRSTSHPEVERVASALIDQHTILADDSRHGSVRVENTHGKDSDDDVDSHLRSSFSSEELTSFVLSYARDIGETEAKTKIKDVVITVPSFYTQSERQSVLDAAMISNLNVLAIVDENVAAAIQFGVDRVYVTFASLSRSMPSQTSTPTDTRTKPTSCSTTWEP